MKSILLYLITIFNKEIRGREEAAIQYRVDVLVENSRAGKVGYACLVPQPGGVWKHESARGRV